MEQQNNVIDFESKKNEQTKLSDSQVDQLNEELNQVVQEDDNLKAISELPSNSGIEEHTPEQGEQKKMMVKVNPETGEHAVVGSTEDNLDDNETFEEMLARVEKETDFSQVTEKDITYEELSTLVKTSRNDKDSMLHDVIKYSGKDFTISDDSLKVVLEIANRKLKKEEFNVYKELPDEVKTMVDKYVISQGIPIVTNEGRQIKKELAELLISEFIQNIVLDRAQVDFNKEIESIFNKGAEEIAEASIGYTTSKNAAMRKYANEQMEDGEKKRNLLKVLDNFDDAYSLTSMKEYAKRCKIKKYDLERPDKIYKNFLLKYVNSAYNIWDIMVVRPILARNLNTETEEFTEKDIDAFFICFCKQCASMKPEVTHEHAYMYNIIYNITLIDINKGKDKNVSDTFVQNIREVIYNLRERNNNYV